MSDTTPDTTFLRSLADRHTGEGWRRMMVAAATVRALCDGYDEAQRLRAEVERLRANGNGYLLRAHAAEATVQQVRAEAADNWRSWEREAGEHARTLGLIGAPKTGEPLSEGEQRRYEAAVERGLRKRAEDQRDAARAEVARLRAVVASVEALHRPTAAVDAAGDYDACVTCFDEYERPATWPCATAAALTAAQDAPAPTGHQHETWQIRESAKGGTYCAACGEHVDPAPTPTQSVAEWADEALLLADLALPAAAEVALREPAPAPAEEDR